MSHFVSAWAAWIRRIFGWLGAVEERLADITLLSGLALVLAGIGIIWGLNSFWSLSHSQVTILSVALLLVALLWLLALAILKYLGWLKLFGPLLFYDLVRVARRHRYFLLRFLYAVLLAALLCWVYLMWHLEGRRAGTLRTGEMALFAESFFYTFMVVQFAVVILLTPAYTAGAIAEEKDRKTLEFLLTTDLRNREIVLSKFLSRLGNITLLLLTGLPILSFLQFLGGVDPNLVLAGFAATALTTLSLAGLSILNSVLTKRPRDAIAVTYFAAAGYLVLSGASWLLLIPRGLATFPSTSTWTSPVTLEDLVYAFNAGNVVAQLVQLVIAVESGKYIATVLPAMLRNYALFHGLVTLICSGWAVMRLRAIALKQSYGKVHRVPLATRLLGRPAVGLYPMMWKEIFVEPGLRLNVLGRIIVVALIIAAFLPLWFIFADHDPWTDLAERMNIWVRVVGAIVANLMLLAVASRASSSISSERDRQTFDALLTSPLGSNAILVAKWVGNILSVRWAWLLLGAIYGLAILTGGLSVLALPLLVLAWIVYAAVVSGIGLWFSLVSRTTLRAAICTLLATAGAGVGHWLIWMCCGPLLTVVQPSDRFRLYQVLQFQVGITPPATLSYSFPFYEGTFERTWRERETLQAIGYGLLGLLIWSAVAAVLWGVTSARFGIVTGRVPSRRQQPPGGYRRSQPALGHGLETRPSAADLAEAISAEEEPPQLRGAVLIEEERPDDDTEQSSTESQR